MSTNDQMLIKKYKERYYVFNVMAESWSKTNPLSVKEAIKSFNTEEEAFEFANNYINDWGYSSEYGISTKLIKDGADVKLLK